MRRVALLLAIGVALAAVLSSASCSEPAPTAGPVPSPLRRPAAPAALSLDEEVLGFPPTPRDQVFASTYPQPERLGVAALLADGRRETVPRRTATTFSLPACLAWWVTLREAPSDAALAALADDLRAHDVPGLSLGRRGGGCVIIEDTGARATSKGLAALATVPSLRWLDLSGTGIDDRSLQDLAGLRDLRHLDLERCSITNEGMAHVARISSLRSLRLGSERVTARGLAMLEQLPELRRLCVSMPCYDGMVEQIARLQSLVDVEVTGELVTDEGVAALASLPHLRRLELVACRQVKGSALAAFAGHARLEALVLVALPWKSDAMRHLASIPRLRSLRIELMPCASADIARLAEVPTLRELDLACSVDAAGLAAIRALPLQKLALLKRFVPPAVEAALRRDMPGCEITLVRELP